MSILQNKINLNLNRDRVVSVKGFIVPMEHTLSHFHIEWDELVNLQVTEPEKRYPTSVFQSFLPSESVSVGDCWQVEETGVLELLRQLNPNPNLDMHIDSGDSSGLWACLRAYNDRFADIQFRIHAEFKLDGGWFTPSQFSGNLIIDQIEEKVVFFKMSVPDGTVNVDINWDSSTDAGFCSKMELTVETQDVVNSTEYPEYITHEEAECKLALCFYKSEQINWISPFEASKLAEDQGKLIHVISIDGPLRDESC